MVFAQSGQLSDESSNEVPSWFTDILLAVVGFAVVWILTAIRSAITALKNELHITNANLIRLDRRVAFLEGRLFPMGKRPGACDDSEL